MAKATLGIIIGNRNFFPDDLIKEGRRSILEILKELDITPIILHENETKFGAVETYEDALKCADLFKKNSDFIDGILVTLPNFGDERAVAESIRLSKLNVPILVHAFPDEISFMGANSRRDSFCGKISVCNNLYQLNIPFTTTNLHTLDPQSEAFRMEIAKFLAVCKTVNGIRYARIGAIGARPAGFNTVRFSEKLLQDSGISTITEDLSEIILRINKLEDNDKKVIEKLDQVHSYANTDGVPKKPLINMAKFGLVIDDWAAENKVDAIAIQCWTSVQNNLGINICTMMSMMSEHLIPNSCEVDVNGALSMYLLQLASGNPSALVDWNNNVEDDPDKCVFFHCGNWPANFLDEVKVTSMPILGSILGEENTFGAVAGKAKTGPFTFARVETDDKRGKIKTYIGEGKITDQRLETFGNYAVVEIKKLQKLVVYICQNGFAHHTAMNQATVSDVLFEALDKYLKWDVYKH